MLLTVKSFYCSSKRNEVLLANVFQYIRNSALNPHFICLYGCSFILTELVQTTESQKEEVLRGCTDQDSGPGHGFPLRAIGLGNCGPKKPPKNEEEEEEAATKSG